ncbi:MAG: hypothetical protein Q8R44_18110 [Novosphingobium sp.]|nr:hypothetical protein [Novosphingobium sp.]
MRAVNITPVIERKALELAERNGVTLDALLDEALVRLLEDEDDIRLAEAALRESDPTKTISHVEMRRELGLDA